MDPQQREQLMAYLPKFEEVRLGTLSRIDKLNVIQRQLKDKEQNLENEMNSIREAMSPFDAAQMVLFCSKFRYRKELSF